MSLRSGTGGAPHAATGRRPDSGAGPEEKDAPGKAVTFAKPKTGYTCIIIDTRGLHVQRAQSPRIYDSAQRMVYGPQFVSRDFAIEVGVVRYYSSLSDARAAAGRRPLVIKALGRTDPTGGSVVISTADAHEILVADRQNHLLRNCQVLFVID